MTTTLSDEEVSNGVDLLGEARHRNGRRVGGTSRCREQLRLRCVLVRRRFRCGADYPPRLDRASDFSWAFFLATMAFLIESNVRRVHFAHALWDFRTEHEGGNIDL